MNLDPFYDELEILIKNTMPLIPEGGCVLDIGCGKGWLTRLLYNNLGETVIGIDMNTVNIADCRNNAHNLPIEYKVLDMVELTPEIYLNFYSFISCHNVLGYIPNPVNQLYKISSWLQTNGLLSLVVRTPSGRFAEVYEQSKSISLALERHKDMRMYGSFNDEFEFYSLSDLISMI
ncbi:class I SAM-dependent methyltransferase [Lysinibacillus capsici]|uniref:class I SAM-dependent methyltransferase n=1 Tax=Lysinibacillus capsici TaxID=2115968 RepID=UPI00248072CC|nr:methyltransferase domain-containing protein [Lysinibacillus capsici]